MGGFSSVETWHEGWFNRDYSTGDMIVANCLYNNIVLMHFELSWTISYLSWLPTQMIPQILKQILIQSLTTAERTTSAGLAIMWEVFAYPSCYDDEFQTHSLLHSREGASGQVP